MSLWDLGALCLGLGRRMLGVGHFVGILVKGDPKVTLTSMSVLMRVS